MNWWIEFWRGLTRPSLPALLITLAFPSVSFVACVLFITPELMASDFHRYFLHYAGDTDVGVTSRVLSLRNAELEEPAVFLFGASSFQSAISSAAALSERIRDEADLADKPFVSNLTANALSILESTALMETLPPRVSGVVLFGINPRSLCGLTHLRTGHVEEGQHAGRLGLRTPLLEEHARLAGMFLPRESGIYFLDNGGFFLPRLRSLVRSVFRGPLEMDRHVWLDDALPLLEQRWATHSAEIRQELDELYRANVDQCLGTLSDVAASVRSRGEMTIVLVESPLAPRSRSEIMGDGFWEDHVARMRTFANENGFLYWDINEEVALEDDDFWDYAHIQPRDVRDRITSRLAERIGQVLRDQEEGSS